MENQFSKKKVSKIKNKFFSLVQEYASSYPGKIVLIDEKSNLKYNWRDCLKIMQRINRFLEIKKLKPGDTVSSGLPNCIENTFIFLSCVTYGYNFAALPEKFSKYEKKKLSKIVKPKITFLNKIITKENIVGEIKISLDSKFSWLPRITKRKNFIEQNSKIFILSSGTTGEPKVIVQNINNLTLNGQEFLKNHNFVNKNSIFLNYLSMSYLGGLYNLLILPLLANASIVITDSFSGITFLNFWKIIARFNITCLWLVPTIIKGILKLHSKNSEEIKSKFGDKIKYSFVGTAPLEYRIKIDFQKKFGIVLLENYGLSETLFISSENLKTKQNFNTNTSGSIINNVRIKFSSYKNTFKKILVKTPYIFEGYIDEKNLLSKDIDSEGFFNTGDLGSNKSNKLSITGRVKDIVKKGGFLVNLREIELIATKIKNVLEASAINVSDDFYGETLVLFFSSKNKIEITEKEKIEFEIFKTVTTKLAKQKWPKKVFLIDNLPKTRSGKISKFQLKRIYEKFSSK